MANGNDNQQSATIKELILSAADGAAAGVEVLQGADIPVELEEFEIEVVYSCTTTITDERVGNIDGALCMKFWFIKAKVRSSYRSKTVRTQSINYGLKVRFLFVGREKESET